MEKGTHVICVKNLYFFLVYLNIYNSHVNRMVIILKINKLMCWYFFYTLGIFKYSYSYSIFIYDLKKNLWRKLVYFDLSKTNFILQQKLRKKELIVFYSLHKHWDAKLLSWNEYLVDCMDNLVGTSCGPANRKRITIKIIILGLLALGDFLVLQVENRIFFLFFLVL